MHAVVGQFSGSYFTVRKKEVYYYYYAFLILAFQFVKPIMTQQNQTCKSSDT